MRDGRGGREHFLKDSNRPFIRRGYLFSGEQEMYNKTYFIIVWTFEDKETYWEGNQLSFDALERCAVSNQRSSWWLGNRILMLFACVYVFCKEVKVRNYM